MPPNQPPPPGPALPPSKSAPARSDRRREVRRFLGRAVPFVLLGLLLYLGCFLASEWLVYQNAERNRFYSIQTAPQDEHDYVILGASHAAVFDYRDMNERLEDMTGTEILNLATVGAGITPNRLLLDYFYEKGLETDAVVYVVDSFAFYSPEWNEERLQDTELFVRAPWDPTLARLLVSHPSGRSVALDYLLGFSKINNPDRFEPDLFEAEGSRFERTYRPVPQIDRQRIEFLYPDAVDETTLRDSPYLAEFEELIRDVQSRGDRFIALRPPVPERIQEMIPGEKQFDRTLRRVLDRHGVALYDLSSVNNDEEYFYDSDHLNRKGALRFFEEHLAAVLTPASR